MDELAKVEINPSKKTPSSEQSDPSQPSQTDTLKQASTPKLQTGTETTPIQEVLDATEAQELIKKFTQEVMKPLPEGTDEIEHYSRLLNIYVEDAGNDYNVIAKLLKILLDAKPNYKEHLGEQLHKLTKIDPILSEQIQKSCNLVQTDFQNPGKNVNIEEKKIQEVEGKERIMEIKQEIVEGLEK
jgi:hypothetical protein